MRAPRLLFYAVNGLGLGHVTRLLALARAVRRACPDSEILFLTTSEASHIVYREGFAALKLPSRNAASSGGLRHASWLRLMQSVVLNTATAFDPHALIVDTFAAGTVHELLPVLRWPLRKVFVFRAQRDERAEDTFFQSTLKLYDLVLIPHHAGEENVTAPATPRVVWTGPMLIRDRDELMSRKAARQALGLPLEGEIALVTLGGGGDPEIAVARSLLAKAIAGSANRALWVETRGPLSRDLASHGVHASGGQSTDGMANGAEFGCTLSEALAENHRLLRDVQPQMPFLAAFDYAVASAGYNTTHEMQAAGLPTIFWPFARDLDDQSDRVRRLAQAGRALSVGEGANPAAERIENLKEALLRMALAPERDALRTAMSNHAVGRAGGNGAAITNGAAIGAAAILQLFS